MGRRYTLTPCQRKRISVSSVADTSAAYSVRDVSTLLGISQDAVRKRLRAGTLQHVSGSSSSQGIDRHQVDDERRELLNGLRALDMHEVAQREAALRNEIERLRTAISDMTIAARALHEADAAHLDALRQVVLPSIVCES